MLATLYTLASAELFLVIFQQQELLIVLKAKKQRTVEEQLRVDRGLKRALLFEACGFVPAVALVLTWVAPVLYALMPWSAPRTTDAFRASVLLPQVQGVALGFAAYVLPFRQAKALLRNVALKALQLWLAEIKSAAEAKP